MIYGLYLSSSGTMATMHAQDAIANNLANVDTAGFKRLMAIFQERPTPRRTDPSRAGDPMLDRIGGGLAVAPSSWDMSQGTVEDSGGPLDVALVGNGYLAVRDQQNNLRLTRNGTLMVDRQGFLAMANTPGNRVLDWQQRPIRLGDVQQTNFTIGKDGAITNGDLPIARLGLFDVADPRSLTPVGNSLFSPKNQADPRPTDRVTVMQGYIEKSNVDPARELTRMIEMQRLLEANANFIRYQDQTLARAVNELGKIG